MESAAARLPGAKIERPIATCSLLLYTMHSGEIRIPHDLRLEHPPQQHMPHGFGGGAEHAYDYERDAPGGARNDTLQSCGISDRGELQRTSTARDCIVALLVRSPWDASGCELSVNPYHAGAARDWQLDRNSSRSISASPFGNYHRRLEAVERKRP